MPMVPTPHDHALPAETLDEKDARLQAEQAATGEERPPTEVEQAYNVAHGELYQLALHGHHRYAPLFDSRTGRYFSINAIQEGVRDYARRIQAAQEQFETAVLLRAAERLEADGGPTCSPGECCWFDAAAALRRLATSP
ncbi:hypothetical protein ACFV1H_17895 [Streptomyces virginiae]|uniref:hypothetical protein n=1 Tax=Streptomyces virginiae TaxID=1961 RepID=UPI0036A744D1